MHTHSGDPDFMIRWLNGELSQEEMSSLRNKDEYEEMVRSGNGGNKIWAEPIQPKVLPGSFDLEKSVVVEEVKTNAFPTFVAIAMASLLAALFIVKLLISVL